MMRRGLEHRPYVAAPDLTWDARAEQWGMESDDLAMGTQQGYETNLASEFYVMSVLNRRGLSPLLTLGNKKAIDIVVHLDDGTTITIDVKAVAKKMDWLVGSRMPDPRPNHFIILVSYEGKFEQVSELPRVWIVPAVQLIPFVKVAGNETTHYISRSKFIAAGERFENAWEVLTQLRDIPQNH